MSDISLLELKTNSETFSVIGNFSITSTGGETSIRPVILVLSVKYFI